MSTPIWQTASGSIGSVKNQTEFTKTLVSTNATTYTLVSGFLPLGVSISSTGILSGIPQLDNIESNKTTYVFEFTIRASDSQNNYVDRNFSLTVLLNLYTPSEYNQNKIRYGQNIIQYQITQGSSDISQNIIWRLDSGATSANISISPGGTITAAASQNVLPLRLEQFVSSPTDLQKSTWANWIGTFLSSVKEYDYQFSVVLNNPTSISKQSYTVRIIFTKIANTESWFVNNPTVTLDTNQYYFFLAISEQNYINWISDVDLGSIVNGSVSELLVRAETKKLSNISYILKPSYTSILPQGLNLLPNGLLAGRINFRTYQDDPALSPVNDDYVFTVRAMTGDTFNYSEQTFNLHVDRVYDSPYDNLWIRSLPAATYRSNIRHILDNQTYFPDEWLYRPEDSWFGKTNLPLRFLFAPGLNPSTDDEYYQAVANNHYRKTVTLSEVKTAVCLNTDLSVRYEVVYLEIQDNLSRFNYQFNEFRGPPDQIDLRQFVSNYYIENNNTYYIFKPNGLANMNNQLKQVIGYYDTGVLPGWMTSLQLSDSDPGIFRAPLGFTPAVVLAYTKPGGSALIKYRLNQDRINFNIYQFEFDRYELDNNQQDAFASNVAAGGSTTVFDDNQTVFENGGTTFIDNQDLGFGGTRGSRNGDKYIKFPNVGAFS